MLITTVLLYYLSLCTGFSIRYNLQTKKSACMGFLIDQYQSNNNVAFLNKNQDYLRLSQRFSKKSIHYMVASYSSTSSSSSSSPLKKKILMEKVLRTVPFPILVEYIRDIFQIPDQDLTIPYYKDTGGTKDSNEIVAFSCPIASDEENTRLSVEALGIFVDDSSLNSGENVLPQMIMVTVSKSQSPEMCNDGEVALQKNLYQDSERKIIRALERGLDELSEGKGYYNQEQLDQASELEKVKEMEAKVKEKSNDDYKHTEEAELVEHQSVAKPEHHDSDDGIIDVVPERVVNAVEDKDDEPEIRTEGKEMIEEERQRSLDNIFENSMEKFASASSSSESLKEAGVEDIEDFQMDSGFDMTPKELLDNVMSFGKEREKEDEVGRGFAEGALGKAKELLNENKLGQKAKVEEENNVEDNTCSPEVLEIDQQEELRRIFEAGERVAEGRIMSAESTENNEEGKNKISAPSSLQDSEIDKLIESDKSVPNTATKLEEDLAELEIRIAKTNGEDGFRSDGDVLDLFSGPRGNNQMNPKTFQDLILTDGNDFISSNPDTTQSERVFQYLPKDLQEAIKNAKFAAASLGKLEQDDDGSFWIENKEISRRQVELLELCVEEAVQARLLDVHPLEEMAERSRLSMLLDELYFIAADNDRVEDILNEYKDLLLSEQFVKLVRERLEYMAAKGEDDEKDAIERQLLTKMTRMSMLLLKEAQSVGAELEASQLEIIRSICKVAMDPKYETEEEASDALTDTIRDMRPLLDDVFVSYLKYAIAEERGRLTRRGLIDDMEHMTWLLVLEAVQEGVYKELAKGVQRHIDHIWYIVRMPTKRERKALLGKLVDVMPSMDVRPFVRVVDNIVASLGSSAKGEFNVEDATVLGGMTKKILQLSRDLKDILPPERIKAMSRDADEYVAQQREKIKQYRKDRQRELSAKREQQSLASADDNELLLP